MVLQQDSTIVKDTARIVSVQDTVRVDSASLAAKKQAPHHHADTTAVPVLESWFLSDTLFYEPVQADTTGTALQPLAADTLTDVAEPLYMKETFFSRDTLLTAGRGRDRLGVAGDPVPYTVRGDNMFTSLLLLCFVIFVISVSNTRQFVYRQVKDFFYPAHSGRPQSETLGEVHFQFFLVGLACLLLSISVYIFATTHIATTYVIDDYEFIALFFGCFAVYFLGKYLLHELVGSVFFTPAERFGWRQAFLFLNALQGMLLFPVVMVQIYFDLSFKTSLYYYGFVLIFVKILTFYKCWSIFFRRNGGFMQNFLYFCTLEIVPLLILVGVMKALIDILKITF